MCFDETSDDLVHRSVKATVIAKDEKDIHNITDVILDRFSNPFTLGGYEEEKETRKPLINISTGVVATDEVAADFVNAKSKGKKTMLTFIESRINTDQIPLDASISKTKLKTFQ